MIRFYLDNDVSLALARQLSELGHDAPTAREQGASHAGDYEQLLLSTELQRVLITHNERHFKDLHATWRLWLPRFDVPAQHGGILVIPQPPRAGQIDMSEELDGLTQQRTTFANELWLWRTTSAWDLVEPRLAYFAHPSPQ